MNGQRALIYSRIRENQLNPGDSDITRALRQQEVMQPTLSKLASTSHVLPPAVQRQQAALADRDRSVDVAVRRNSAG